MLRLFDRRQDANVYLFNVTKTTIIATSFTNNKRSALYVEEGSTLDLNRVTFERTSATNMGSYYVSIHNKFVAVISFELSNIS